MTVLDATVVIPVHDRAEVLASAVRSVLEQTLPARRIVVVDDGSSDASIEVAAGLPVTLLRHETARGSGAARNTGIAAADTEWIAFLDSDDVWHAEHLERSAGALGTHAFVTSPMVDSFGRGVGNTSGAAHAVTPEQLFFPENVVCTSTVVARTDLIRRVGGFTDLPRAQDLDLWVRLLGVGTGLALPTITGVYTASTQYQEAGLRARSVAGADQVRLRYAGEPWMTERLDRRVRTRLAWDGIRHAQHHRDASGVLRGIRELGVAPSTIGALRDLLAYRRRGRRFVDAA